MYFGRKLDELNRTLLITGACSLIAGNLIFPAGTVPRRILSILAAVSLIFAVIRLFGGNPERRSQENIRFLSAVTSLRSRFYRAKDGIRNAPGSVRRFFSGCASRFQKKCGSSSAGEDGIRYKVLRCPSCRQKLRVPKGKGKIRVTCTHCGNRFEAKS